MDVAAGVFLIVGAAFVLLAGVGVVRFDDVFSRMHAAAKAQTLGVLCVAVGAALSIRTVQATVVVMLVALLQLMTGTVGSHMLGRAVYRSVKLDNSGLDELAAAEATAESGADADHNPNG